MADCRECAKCFGVVEGVEIQCATSICRVPWSRSRGMGCDDFEPKPAPASPPASADRDGTDLLEAAKAIRQYVHGNYTWDSTYSRAFDAFKRAISSEEARRARPASDPRDALLRQCATDFARVRDYAPVLDRTPVDNSGCEDCARAREHTWPPSRLCETHYSKAAQQERANEQLLATQDFPMREIAREALEALRAAGVEPAHGAEEGKGQ